MCWMLSRIFSSLHFVYWSKHWREIANIFKIFKLSSWKCGHKTKEKLWRHKKINSFFVFVYAPHFQSYTQVCLCEYIKLEFFLFLHKIRFILRSSACLQKKRGKTRVREREKNSLQTPTYTYTKWENIFAHQHIMRLTTTLSYTQHDIVVIVFFPFHILWEQRKFFLVQRNHWHWYCVYINVNLHSIEVSAYLFQGETTSGCFYIVQTI